MKNKSDPALLRPSNLSYELKKGYQNIMPVYFYFANFVNEKDSNSCGNSPVVIIDLSSKCVKNVLPCFEVENSHSKRLSTTKRFLGHY
jgi:hypothetical protein